MIQFYQNPRGKRGFTLIELLIVIAIILILIAIALPNFMEAQQRAKVAKAKGEMRTYTAAMESYRLDFGGFPRDHDSIWPHPVAGDQDGYTQLTSPIKYLSSLPRDPWGEQVTSGGTQAGGVARNRAFYYEGGSGSDETASRDGKPGGQCGSGGRKILYRDPTKRNWGSGRCCHAYLILSIGPNADDETGGNDDFPYSTVLTVYNPTNGTRSAGDIYKTIGEWKRAYSLAPGLGVYRNMDGSNIAKYQQEGE
jgi:type II secretion system protein G